MGVNLEDRDGWLDKTQDIESALRLIFIQIRK